MNNRKAKLLLTLMITFMLIVMIAISVNIFQQVFTFSMFLLIGFTFTKQDIEITLKGYKHTFTEEEIDSIMWFIEGQFNWEYAIQQANDICNNYIDEYMDVE